MRRGGARADHWRYDDSTHPLRCRHGDPATTRPCPPATTNGSSASVSWVCRLPAGITLRCATFRAPPLRRPTNRCGTAVPMAPGLSMRRRRVRRVARATSVRRVHIDAVQCDIDVDWVTPWSLFVKVAGLLEWQIDIRSTMSTRLMSAIGGRLPSGAWTNRAVLGALGRAAGPTLGAGRVRLAGTAPNGQRFTLAPRQVWAVAGSRAALDGRRPRARGTAAEPSPTGRLPAAATGSVRCGLGTLRDFR